MTKKLNDRVKKNLLDLEYDKYLQYFNTSIIILFTYVIGISIAFITKQIDYHNSRQLVSVALISALFLSLIATIIFRLKENLTRIPKELKKLKL